MSEGDLSFWRVSCHAYGFRVWGLNLGREVWALAVRPLLQLHEDLNAGPGKYGQPKTRGALVHRLSRCLLRFDKSFESVLCS